MNLEELPPWETYVENKANTVYKRPKRQDSEETVGTYFRPDGGGHGIIL